MRLSAWWGLLPVLALVACTTPDAQVPPFARVPYQAFSRQAVIAIALREWRLFGEQTQDAPAPGDSERAPGLWQRIGEYWWLGMDAGSPESGWTGKHNAAGRVFPADEDERYAWSAAFVSYVMRIAGAGRHFPYAPDHATYIDAAKRMALGEASGWVVTAERPEAYAPQPGDLICRGRGWASGLHYNDLPVEHFPAHCDIVVRVEPNQLTSIGGNVDNAVTERVVPTTPDGRLATPDGSVVDPKNPWMVVLRLPG